MEKNSQTTQIYSYFPRKWLKLFYSTIHFYEWRFIFLPNLKFDFIRIEDKRRKKEIFVTVESLPTIENIFDKNRTMDIAGIE